MSLIIHRYLVQLILYFCWISESILCQALNESPVSGSNEGSFGASYFFYQQAIYPRDCTEARNRCPTNSLSGVYLVKPDGFPEPFEVYCDNAVDSEGWTVIFRKVQGGNLLFNRSWIDYKEGFGFLSQEFYIGNEKLSLLTNQNTYELRIDLTSSDGRSFHVTYNMFRISDEYGAYRLTSVGEYNDTEEGINRFLCQQNGESNVYISPDCSQKCYCKSGQFICDSTYQCSTNAECEERHNVLQCYCNTGYKGDGVNCTIDVPPSDCQDVYDRVSTQSGVYKIKPTTWQREPFDVYCNMTDGGGWTVFQRRVNGSLNFFLYWSDYKNGFGTADHELWLGNDKMNSITAQGSYELRVDLVNSLGNPYYAKYTSVRISDENDNYRLNVGTYSGTAGNSLGNVNGQAFTTRDRDNDNASGSNCATNSYNNCRSPCSHNSGWWYKSCGIPLNGPYGSTCLYWSYLPAGDCNVKYSEMKIRPI